MSQEYDFNQYSAPQPQAPEAPAQASAAKPEIKKLLALAAAAIAAIILLVIIFGNGVPGKVEDEIEDYIDDTYGFEVKSLDKEIKVSDSGAKMFVVSGKFKGETDEELYEDYEGGCFLAYAVEYEGDVWVFDASAYEDKDDMKDDLKDIKEEYREDKDEAKEALESYVEIMEALDEEEDN